VQTGEKPEGKGSIVGIRVKWPGRKRRGSNRVKQKKINKSGLTPWRWGTKSTKNKRKGGRGKKEEINQPIGVTLLEAPGSEPISTGKGKKKQIFKGGRGTLKNEKKRARADQNYRRKRGDSVV